MFLLSDFNFATCCYQVTQVNPGSLVSLVYQDPRVNRDSQASDFQDPQDLKVHPLPHFLHKLNPTSPLPSLPLFFSSPQDSQESPDSLELRQDQADQVLMGAQEPLDYLALR